MATLNISYHHSIIHNYTCYKNNSCKFCPKSSSIFVKKPLILKLLNYSATSGSIPAVSANASRSVEEVLPPVLDSSSNPPAIFDETPKLYISYSCPYAQRVWITRNWTARYNKTGAYRSKEQAVLVQGKSVPRKQAKIEFAEELFSFTGSFYKAVTTSLKENRMDEAGAAFDEIEIALSKFNDGPFFLGKFSLVDIAYAPFIERFRAFFSDLKNYDITSGRPRFALWVEEMNKIEAYKQTQLDPKEHVESYKKRFLSSK
ncbi:glutathione s-transferase l2 chloroplastic [Phtheirospermum japonicum]|uniref:Glutathione s-transferase l2 chloroplastic n=1 Tax=Phtheirospermum japonicum TaxID=374723 RepID=A0A830BUR4_9LAMI|nr:glutathione s-transferase l2 chloroplastic [Phtheirospermum japonicum]